ncbi:MULTISPECIES: flavodoxin domain-containing protein [unclassified Streptomyces]|uniref:flavodoxin domain-containing protein n=1 Tax=unclassified Streptomyces TaxID=2593676 RepID=UPI002DDC6F25|nr:flavodoxin domain-containing protein [Streptomyces sp. NBC_01750]WSB01389.1 flavodoxin domain-containing protein [Streptomyces sp. NBC_01794]WSD34263.1 flavodoxin domain-containing protein [Streptomyces sp. NBC_01750]
MARRALVAYGTRNGSTRGMAEAVKDALRTHGIGIGAEVYPASEVSDGTPYDVGVLGGALYAGRQHGDAVRFARRHRARCWIGRCGCSAAVRSTHRPTSGTSHRLEARARGQVLAHQLHAVGVRLLGLYGPAGSGPPR